METYEIRNAVIESVTLSNERGLSAWLMLDFGDCGQGFGGLLLYSANGDPLAREVNYCGHFIWRVLQVAGVERWERLPGKTIRVQRSFSHIKAIGHILKDDWFDPREEFEELASKVMRAK